MWPAFHPAEPLTDRDVEEVTALLHRRILRHLARSGRLRREAAEVEPEPDEPLLAEIYSASLQGRGVLAERGQPGLEPLGRRREARPLSLPGELCASLAGFSLHAKVALEADDHAGRERLARYLTRPPIASERLSLAEDGRVVYCFRRRVPFESIRRIDSMRCAHRGLPEGRHARRRLRAARLPRPACSLGAAPEGSSPDLPRRARAGGRLAGLDRAR